MEWSTGENGCAAGSLKGEKPWRSEGLWIRIISISVLALQLPAQEVSG